MSGVPVAVQMPDIVQMIEIGLVKQSLAVLATQRAAQLVDLLLEAG